MGNTDEGLHRHPPHPPVGQIGGNYGGGAEPEAATLLYDVTDRVAVSQDDTSQWRRRSEELQGRGRAETNLQIHYLNISPKL